MKVRATCSALALICLLASSAAAQTSAQNKGIELPSGKLLSLPAPGGPQRTNSFPTAVAVSPDGAYLAILNNGYGTAESKFQQSIALLDLRAINCATFRIRVLRFMPSSRIFSAWRGAVMETICMLRSRR